MKNKVSIPLLLLVAVFLLGCSRPEKTLTILHFNDVYNIQPVKKGEVGGAARVATLLKQYEGENPLILFSGDALSSSYLSIYLKGRQVVDVFGRLGLDYAVLGNHEFDFGMDVLKQRIRESQFTWLISNITEKATGRPPMNIKRSVMTEFNGVKVGIIGLAGDWLNATEGGRECAYEDYVQVGRELARGLKVDGADVVIALTHMFMEQDEVLAKNVPEIDLILGGHDHEPLKKIVNSTLILKSGADWENVGLIRITLKDGQRPRVTSKFLPVTPKIQDDPAMARIVSDWVALFDEAAGKEGTGVLGETTAPLDVRQTTVRYGESNFGNFVADAIREYAKTDVAITNGGGLRSDRVYPRGKIGFKDLAAILPFPNHVVSVRLTGAQIRKMLENGVSEYEKGAGRFPQVSGLRYVFDPRAPAGSRIIKVAVAGRPLDDNKVYTVATNDYMADGGDGYEQLKNVRRLLDENSSKLMLHVVVDALKKNKVISPKMEGRIQTVARTPQDQAK